MDDHKNEYIVRSYMLEDYPAVEDLYKSAKVFDPETDLEHRLRKKIETDPDSILVAEYNQTVVGTVSLIHDERIALFFRLVSVKQEGDSIRTLLLDKGEEIFRRLGYSEAHIIAPEHDHQLHTEYENTGFKRGNPYRWFWKEL